ncbi:unnamed protein product [Rhizophagus irregularis]|nr:unnamed protein product [Rhizophagus irregularis]
MEPGRFFTVGHSVYRKLCETVQKMASQCLESFEREKNLPDVVNFWRDKSKVMKTIRKASILNSQKIINNMLELHCDFNEALTNTTRQNIKPALKRKEEETIIDAENSLFVSELSERDSNDATVSQDELVPLKNTHKRLFSETGDDLPSSHIISVMEQYRVKSTTSKYDLVHSFILDLTPCSRIEKEFEPEFWAELIADRPPAANAKYYEEIGTICDHLFGPANEKRRTKLHESRDKWEKIRELKAPEHNDDFSYHEEDWKKILYWVERAVGTFLDAFESEYNPIQQNDCGEREWFGEYVLPIFQGALKLNSFCRVPWGEVTVVASCRRRNEDKNKIEVHLERGHLADLLCKIDQQEVVCGLACGGPHKYDLTKWASDEYQLPRMLKDTLDDILEKFRGAGRNSSDLYTIGIQLYMAEIRIYVMEKRDVYRLHLLKSLNLPLLHSSYGKLRLALSWAWNIRGLVKELSLKLDDSAIVSSKTPERDPPNEMKTTKTPEKSKKKKIININ